MDRNLSRKSHIKNIKYACHLNILKCLSNCYWASDVNPNKNKYIVSQNSTTDLWYIVQPKVPFQKELDIIHNTGLPIGLGTFCTSPTLSICSESSEVLLEFRKDILTMSFASRVLAAPENPVIHNILNNRFISYFSIHPWSNPLFLWTTKPYTSITLSTIYPISMSAPLLHGPSASRK